MFVEGLGSGLLVYLHYMVHLEIHFTYAYVIFLRCLALFLMLEPNTNAQ